jgi:hypothetical protein
MATTGPVPASFVVHERDHHRGDTLSSHGLSSSCWLAGPIERSPVEAPRFSRIRVRSRSVARRASWRFPVEVT